MKRILLALLVVLLVASTVKAQIGGVQIIEGTVTATATDLDIRDLSASQDNVAIHSNVGVITQLDLTNSDPIVVAIVDGVGDQLTSFGGGTQYTEADTDTTITGTAIMFESNTGTSQVDVVSNTTPLPISDAGGNLSVDGIVSSAWNLTCGTTAVNAAFQLIPSPTPTAPSGFTTTTCLASITCANVTGAQRTLTVQDGQGVPVVLINAAPIPGNTTVTLPFYGALATTGIEWASDTASSLACAVSGWQ